MEEVAQFENRASAAESQLVDLFKRMEKLENQSPSADSTFLPILLDKLRELQQQLLTENQKMENIILERDKLLVENTKQEYRIKHLVRMLNEEEAKQSSSSA